MFKKLIFIVLVLNGLIISAQTAILGQLDIGNTDDFEQKVYLTKLNIGQLQNAILGQSNSKNEQTIAWSPINKNGTFAFDRKHIEDKDAIYRLYTNRMQNAINDSTFSMPFIMSSSDSVEFRRSESTFANYTTTNLADKEWKRLREFEMQLLQSQLGNEDDAIQLKNYTKDSLRILIVKLVGIQQLRSKQLLDQDIAKNPTYYLTLLEELKASKVPSKQYHFLEKRLAFLTQEIIEEKYAWSKMVNFVLGFLLLGFGGILVFRFKRKPISPSLSKQELTIQNLILQGKSNKEIANELFISLSTVKSHITNIYKKLRVSSRQELVQKTHN